MLEKDLQESILIKEMHNTIDEEEEEETLSLCDLPLYDDQKQDQISQESQGLSSMSSIDNDCFEFNQELNPNPSTTIISHPENIIFCGKLIPYKKPDDIPRQNTFERKQPKQKKSWGLFGWRSSCSRSSKIHVYSTRNSFKQPTIKKSNDKSKNRKGYEFPVHKMSILTSSPSGKARWYLLLFGISKVSTEVDLKDMKNRQSRRLYPSPSSSPLFRVDSNRNEEIIGDRSSNGWWGLWGLIRALSCGGNHHPNMVSEARTCSEREC